jgi:hypothetical protein
LLIADFQSSFIAFFLPPRSFRRAVLIIDFSPSQIRSPQSAISVGSHCLRKCQPRMSDSAHCERTSAPPFEQRHQKSNMRQSGADLAGLPLITLGGD